MVTILIQQREHALYVPIHVQHVIIKNALLAKQFHISIMEDVTIAVQLKHHLFMVFIAEIV